MPDADSLVTRDDQGGFTGKKDLLQESQEYTAAWVGRWLASVKQSGGDM